ncbi:MAG TPA: hypothetical protein VF024_03540, partial [Solirubrobacteraceae bacterium]
RHERLSDVELQPIAPPGQRERRRRPRAAIPRGWLVAVVVLGLLAGLWVIGNRNQGDGGGAGSTPPAASTPSTATSSSSKASSSKKKAKKKAKAKPKLVSLRIVATGQVYVCLKAAGKRTPVPGIVLTGGARQGPYKSSKFRLQLGTSEARLIVNGKSRTVPPVPNGIGYEITPRKVRRLPASQWPRCPTA